MCQASRGKGRDRSPRNECGKAAGSQNLQPLKLHEEPRECRKHLPKEGRTYCRVENVRKRIRVCLPERRKHVFRTLLENLYQSSIMKHHPQLSVLKTLAGAVANPFLTILSKALLANSKSRASGIYLLTTGTGPTPEGQAFDEVYVGTV